MTFASSRVVRVYDLLKFVQVRYGYQDNLFVSWSIDWYLNLETYCRRMYTLDITFKGELLNPGRSSLLVHSILSMLL